MKLATILLALCTFCCAQQSPAEVPVENEPHHHLVFENEYVRVFKVEVAPHEATLIHRHKRDYVVVTIGDAEVTNAVVGKEPKKWSFKDGDVTFLEASGEKSFAHKAVNDASTTFVNYTIELKLATLPRSEAGRGHGYYVPEKGGVMIGSSISSKQYGCYSVAESVLVEQGPDPGGGAGPLSFVVALTPVVLTSEGKDRRIERGDWVWVGDHDTRESKPATGKRVVTIEIRVSGVKDPWLKCKSSG